MQKGTKRGRPFRRRRLAHELTDIRESLGWTAEQAAREAGVSQSSISRVEGASVSVQSSTLRAILDAYQVTGERREAITSLAKTLNAPTWWHAYGDVVPDWLEIYVDLEAEASSLAVYSVQFVDGLLQTDGYARAVYAAGRLNEAAATTERQVQLRMERQKRVLAGEMVLEIIMEEWALHRVYGDQDVMRAQFQHMLDIAQLRNVSLQLLKTTSQPNVVGSFALLDFPEVLDPTVAYIEHEAGALYVEEPDQVRRYSQAYDRLRACAMSPAETIAEIAKLAKEV